MRKFGLIAALVAGYSGWNAWDSGLVKVSAVELKSELSGEIRQICPDDTCNRSLNATLAGCFNGAPKELDAKQTHKYGVDCFMRRGLRWILNEGCNRSGKYGCGAVVSAHYNKCFDESIGQDILKKAYFSFDARALGARSGEKILACINRRSGQRVF